MTTHPGYDVPPEMMADEKEHRRKLARALAGAIAGKLNCVVDVTLRASQTTTTFSDPRISAFSAILLMPTTANASTAEKAGIYVSGRTTGQATLNHASNAATDQTFTAVIFG